MNENMFIELPEIITLLHYGHTKWPERNCREWLSAHGIRQFRRGGIYIRDFVLNAIKEEAQKCLQSEKEGKYTTSAARYVSAIKGSQSPKGLRDLINEKTQSAMQYG